LLPADTAVQHLPQVNMPSVVAGYAKLGQAVQVSGAPASGLVRMTEGDEQVFFGLGEIDDQGRVAPRRMMVL
ncbi:MAG: tRNA pseudouridine(55) synthase TruB, partial [Plesiomonas shigelloides]